VYLLQRRSISFRLKRNWREGHSIQREQEELGIELEYGERGIGGLGIGIEDLGDLC